MKGIISMAGAALLVGAASGQTIRLGNDQGDGIEQKYNYYYSRAQEKTFVGYVAGKVKGEPNNGVAGSMGIFLKTKNKTYQVDLGPTWYVQNQTATVNVGDKVKITGDLVTLNSSKADHEKVIIARQVVRGRQILALRDRNGSPYWKAYRQGKVAMSGENSLNGTFMGQDLVSVGKDQQIAYHIKTDNGVVDVAVAPNWYLEQQGLGFHVGDNLTVYTGVGAAKFGDMIVADGIYGTSGTLVLRPNGVPVWNGWSSYVGP